MKRIFILLFLLPLLSKAQVYQAMPQAGYGPVKRMLFDSVLTLPLGIAKLQNITGGRDTGQIRYNKSDSSIYTYSGNGWRKVSGGNLIDTTSLSNRINLKVSKEGDVMTGALQFNGTTSTSKLGTDNADAILSGTQLDGGALDITAVGGDAGLGFLYATNGAQGLSINAENEATALNITANTGTALNIFANTGTALICSSIDGYHANFGNNKVIINNIGKITTTNNVQANAFIKTGGTSSQYLMADGSVNSNTMVNSITATSPITVTTGSTPVISTSMATNKLIGRSTASTGVMEQIAIGSGLTLSGGTLTNTATPTPTGYYGAWQDNNTQTATVSNIGYPMIFRTIDLSNGVSVNSNGTNLTRITFANTGIYNLQFSSQFQNTDNAQHDINIWLRLNGSDVSGSNGLISIPARKSSGTGNEGHLIAGWNYLLNVVAGQYYEVIWSTSNAANVTMQYYSAGSPPPSAASVILTVTQQSGIMAGTGITAINSLTDAAQNIVTGTDSTDFKIVSSGTQHKFNLPTASATKRGALSSADWSTFNSKMNLTDTASLSTRINTKLNSADTVTISNRINTKLNSTDTASLSTRINTKISLTGNETIAGTKTFSSAPIFNDTWANGQATFGSASQAGKINFLRGSAAIGGTIGMNSAGDNTILAITGTDKVTVTSTGDNTISTTGTSNVIAINAQGTNGLLKFRTSATQNAQVFQNGNWVFQNGGTFTDGGDRIQVTGNITSTATVKADTISTRALTASGNMSAANFTGGSGTYAYAGVTWTGTSPSGTPNYSVYNWTQTGKLVTLFIAISYPTAGLSNAQLTLPLPSGVPAVYYPSGTATGEAVYFGTGIISSSATITQGTNTARLAFLRNTVGGELQIMLGSGTVNAAKFATITIQYFTP